MTYNQIKDFFISYTNDDIFWAEWIAWVLEEAGYSAVIQAWDFQPGSNFVLEMHKAASETKRTIAVLSQAYLDAEYTFPEWAAAFKRNPNGSDRILIPVRVRQCKPAGILASIVYIDLVGLSENGAKQKLLSAFSDRAKPGEPPVYPGRIGKNVKLKPARRFPERMRFPTAEAINSSFKKPWNVTFPRNFLFTGRKDILTRLDHTLHSSNTVALNQPQIITGLGGIGKTQTAIEYAHRFRDDYEAVFWVAADSEQALISGFMSIAQLLNLREETIKDPKIVIAAVKRWLKKNRDWLLIFDNADMPSNIESFMPANHQGNILITSRARNFDRLGVTDSIELVKLQPQEALEFLLKRTGRKGVKSVELKAAEELAKELDFLPLALEQAGAFIYKMNSTFCNYLIGYRKRGLELLEKIEPILGQYSKSVVSTWSLNFEKIRSVSTPSVDLLCVSAFLYPHQIPLEIFTLGALDLGPELSKALGSADPLVLDELLEPLTQYSLIRRDLELRSYDIHRLVQAVIKETMNGSVQRQWAERTVRAVYLAFPSGKIEFSIWPICERILPHALICSSLIDHWRFEFEEAAQLLNQTGLYLSDIARYQEAKNLYNQALSIFDSALEHNHPDTAACLNNLATIYDNQCRYTEAEPLHLRALEIRERILGGLDPAVSQSLNNLALHYKARKNFSKAESLFKRSIEINEGILEGFDRELAAPIGNLAILYDEQKRYEEAERLHQRAVNLWINSVGIDHPDTATSLNNLAGHHYSQEKYEMAEPLYRQAAQIIEKTIGGDHPLVGKSLLCQALVNKALKKFTKAESLYQQALDILEKKLGPLHSLVITNLKSLADLYETQSEYNHAEKIHKRVLKKRSEDLGPENPNLATDLTDMALFYMRQGKSGEAEPLFEQALDVLEKSMGTGHPSVIYSIYNVAGIYTARGKYEEAEKLYFRAIVINEKTFGAESLEVVVAYENYVTLLRKMGRKDEAVRLESSARAIKAKFPHK